MKGGHKVMMILGMILVVVGGVLIYWNIPYSPYKARFVQQMESRTKDIKSTNAYCTSQEIEQLPEPLKHYAEYIGLEGFPKYQVARTQFKNTRFVFDSQSGKILDMDYDLWLFYDAPYRSAYCISSMFGVPFDGIDYCTKEQEGGMKGILGKSIQIFDVRDKQGYKAGLISWLAESVAINPSALLSPYVTYEVLDELHVKATVTYNGVSGSGIITLNEEGAITTFYSDERQVEELEGVKTAVGWRCEYENYKQRDELKQISTVRSIKVFPDKEVVYFESDDFKVMYLK